MRFYIIAALINLLTVVCAISLCAYGPVIQKCPKPFLHRVLHFILLMSDVVSSLLSFGFPGFADRSTP